MAKHYVGDSIEIVGEFRNPVTRVLQDPSTVVCTVKKPDGTTFAPATATTETGIHTATAVGSDNDIEGEYVFEMEGTGSNPGKDQGRYFVHPSGVV